MRGKIWPSLPIPKNNGRWLQAIHDVGRLKEQPGGINTRLLWKRPRASNTDVKFKTLGRVHHAVRLSSSRHPGALPPLPPLIPGNALGPVFRGMPPLTRNLGAAGFLFFPPKQPAVFGPRHEETSSRVSPSPLLPPFLGPPARGKQAEGGG